MVKKEEKVSNAWGVASMVTGILSLCLFLMPYFGLPLGIFAIVTAAVQRKKAPNGVATAGLITGILGTILNAIVCFVLLVFVAAFAA